MTSKDGSMYPDPSRVSTMKIVEPSYSTTSSTNQETSGSTWTVRRICNTAIDTVNQILIVCTTIFLLGISLQNSTITNSHVALCTVGYVLLMSEAIVVLAGENAANFLTRRAKSHIHWVLQVLGAICTLAGVVIMYRAKSSHFRSIHAILGITSVAVMCFLLVTGYPVLVAVKLRKIVRPIVIKCAHNFLGISCFVIGMISQIYGYQKTWLNYTCGLENIETIMTIVTAFITVFTLRGAFESFLRQIVALFK